MSGYGWTSDNRNMRICPSYLLIARKTRRQLVAGTNHQAEAIVEPRGYSAVFGCRRRQEVHRSARPPEDRPSLQLKRGHGPKTRTFTAPFCPRGGPEVTKSW